MTRPTLSVIILNWNGRPFLEDCLTGVAGQRVPADYVTLVDNDSADGSVDFVRERFPWVEILENGGNIGFAAGNNAALRRITTDLVLLLNPDVIPSPGCFAALIDAMSADASIGMVGCKLWYPGDEVIQHAGGYITHPQAMPGHYGIGERDEGQHDAARDVEYVIGAAVAIRRQVLEEIGLLDEGYFLYFEDADLCARSIRAGYRVVYLPQATGIHVESATAVKGSFAYLQRFHSGRWRYLLKHFPAAELIGETFAAEGKWLGRLAAAERRAVGLAYLATLRRLPEILAARRDSGAGPLDDETRDTLRAGLLALREQAAQPDSPPLENLSAAAELRQQPFTSTVPLFGPLIARFRNAWNNVASRWYLDHLMTQQNQFNRLAVRRLEQYEAELAEQIALLEEQVVITADMEQQIARLQAEIAELRRQLPQ